ncbi:hypothetical protein ACWC2K_05335 [Streptomyces chattanoogensis]|uniref:hypothetical protein n=1 Tax=Streptomyces chattanoogensis TaxID=66876 RepID=UPI0036C5F89B
MTPPPADQPPYPSSPAELSPPVPPSPPQLPPARPRNRRALVAGIIAVVVLLVAGGTATAWWLTRGEDGSPLAGRPRVTDKAAGLSYALPEGWKEGKRGGLIAAFTSSITARHTADKGGSMVAAGRARSIPESALKRQAESAARSNAEFFYPDGGSTVEESRATTVSGRPAHTVALKVHDGRGGATGHLRLTLVAADDSHSAFLLGLAQPAGAAERKELDAVLESAALR